MPLYLVSTPIGNLQDITLRAMRILQECDLILAEDTRRTGILFKALHLQRKAQFVAYHEHSEKQKIPWILEQLHQGKEICLVSDNGTPCISDPGFLLVRACTEAGIKVIPLPGPSAALSALVCSGFPVDAFLFLGFLPKKEKAKQELFKHLSPEHTVVFYESPYRLKKTLALIAAIIPDRKLCVAREMTKKFEEFIRGTATEVFTQMKEKEIKGEIVLVVSKI
ncbi:16S rRNA (cytidine(1402)-2'-O)-methyltransferase [Candidatus Woesearchaeota archaeon]|nr:16S rRNA (cytidine(1402)-2'-O)-methyltransferase [Candidatus Woesearchaeota archaeon]